jgi:hypothetical protein
MAAFGLSADIGSEDKMFPSGVTKTSCSTELMIGSRDPGRTRKRVVSQFDYGSVFVAAQIPQTIAHVIETNTGRQFSI